MGKCGLLIGVLALMVGIGCAERQTDPQIEAHGGEWLQIGSADFHGDRVRASGGDGCATCHGDNYRGVPHSPGCYECHDGAGGHPEGYAVVSSDVFHDRNVEATGPTPCQDCHGENYEGDWTSVSCFSCHAGGPSGHPSGWLDYNATTFHGRRVQQEGPEECWRCHGLDGTGGTSEVVCHE